MFNLSDFMGQTKDFSRAYTFYVMFQPPVGSMGIVPLMYYVRGSSLPASTIDPTSTSWQGNAYKVGTTQTFADFTVQFNIDVMDEAQKTMNRWIHKIHNINDNHHGQPGEYMVPIYVHHLSHTTGLPINVYTLHGAWPTSVGQITMDYASKELAQFEVTFAYQYHTILSVS